MNRILFFEENPLRALRTRVPADLCRDTICTVCRAPTGGLSNTAQHGAPHNGRDIRSHYPLLPSSVTANKWYFNQHFTMCMPFLLGSQRTLAPVHHTGTLQQHGLLLLPVPSSAAPLVAPSQPHICPVPSMKCSGFWSNTVTWTGKKIQQQNSVSVSRQLLGRRYLSSKAYLKDKEKQWSGLPVSLLGRMRAAHMEHRSKIIKNFISKCVCLKKNPCIYFEGKNLT